MDDLDQGMSSGTPITAQMRSKMKKALPLMASLREVIGPGGEAMQVKVPFSTSDLNSWREVRNYKDDPGKVAKRLELVVKNQNPDWCDIDLMLSQLTETEKKLIIKTSRARVEGQIAGRDLQGTVEQVFSNSNSQWNPNDEGDYALLVRY